MPVTIYLAGLQEPALLAGPSAEVIKDAAFLRGASEEMRQAAANLLVPVAAARDEWIIASGERAAGLYILVSGSVEIFDAQGEYLLTISGRGQFGEDALFHLESGIGAARAITPARLWLLDRTAFNCMQPFAADNPGKQDLLLWI